MPTTTVSIIVKFWQEDGVWNASTEDLPIAVFGESFDEARAAVEAAVTEHVQMAHEMGLLPSILAHLKERTVRHTAEELEPGELLARHIAPLPELSDCHA